MTINPLVADSGQTSRWGIQQQNNRNMDETLGNKMTQNATKNFSASGYALTLLVLTLCAQVSAQITINYADG